MRRLAFFQWNSTAAVLLAGVLFTHTGHSRHIKASEEISVSSVLQQEVGQPDFDRAAHLEEVLAEEPELSTARWQAGYVWFNSGWLKYDEVPGAVSETRLQRAYELFRQRSPLTIDGRMKLADWCRERKQMDRFRAHLHEVLRLDPDNFAVRKQLGHEQINGRWHTPEEIASIKTAAKERAQALSEWRPELERIKRELNSRSQKRRELAKEKLKEITDPDAVVAIAAVFYGAGESLSQTAVELISQIKGVEASKWLAEQAIFAPSDAIRENCVASLKYRPWEEFVPLLIDAMQNPVYTFSFLSPTIDGRLIQRQMWFKEGETLNADQLKVADVEYRRVRVPFGNHLETTGRAFGMANFSAAASNLQAAANAQETIALNNHIANVLANATGQELDPTPKAWFDWWIEYNEYHVDEQEQVATSYSHGRQYIVDRYSLPFGQPTPRGFNVAPFYPQIPTGPKSCLAAGTPVWTETGLKPIEKIQVGDRVLSKDIETGELAYKVVLETTTRPPARMKKMEVEGESLTLTGGHVVWVSGKGWIRARDVERNGALHTVEGSTGVKAVEDAVDEEAYNLIVEGFHTYFLGQSRILTHDNVFPTPTLAVVPGLKETAIE